MSRIIILGTAFPYRGGLAAFNEMLARKFKASGDAVRIFTFKLQYPSFLFPGKTQYLSQGEIQQRKENVVSITREVNSVNPFNWIRVGMKIRRDRPDMLILKYWHPYFAPCQGTICRLIKGNKHTVIISQLDNVVAHESHKFDSILTRYFIGGVDGFIYMSDSVRVDLEKFTKTKPAVFSPHPVFENFGEKVDRNAAAEKLGLDSNIKYALFFGIVRDYKGLDLLLEAWADAKKKGNLNNTKLIVAGEYYNNKDKYTAMINDLSLEDDVLVHDHFIDDYMVKYYFSLADILVQPYRDATQSGVTQIAYQFELPMIVTSVGGLAEIVANDVAGYVVEPDVAEISEAILKSFDQKNIARLRENMVEEKKRFSWERMCDNMKKLEEKIRENGKYNS